MQKLRSVARADNSGWSLYRAQRAQPVASRQMERLRKRLKQAKNGKEGVDGSSPSEGSEKSLLIRPFCLLSSRRFQTWTSTERPPPAANASREAWRPCRCATSRAYADIHPASTARSSASVSRSETACW